MVLVLAALLGWALGASWCAWSLWQARQRTYRYAVERTDFTEAGRAYSDMATVIVLDGNVNDHAEAT